MKKLNALVLLLFLFSNLSFSQTCLPNGIEFLSQTEIDDFATQYPNCTEILGNVSMGVNTNDITNLNGLSQVTSIGGDLLIEECDDLVNLSGLENLTQVGGFVKVENNGVVTSVAGLDGLISIGGSLDIKFNPLLTDIPGLNDLSSVFSVVISENNAMENVSGLNSLTTVSEDFQVSASPILNQISGFQNLDSVGGDFAIAVNIMLTDLSGFSNLTTVQGFFQIYQVDALINLSDFQNLNFTGGLSIDSNAGLENLIGLENLTTIDGNIFLFRNTALTSLTGLENLNSAIDLRIIDNDALTSVEALANLNSTIDDFSVISNAPLSSLVGLGNIASITGDIQILEHTLLTSLLELESIDLSGASHLIINDNVGLSLCSASNICDYLAGNGLVSIFNNGVGCNDTIQILDVCNAGNSTTCSPNNLEFKSQEDIDIFSSLYPNCTEILGNVSIGVDSNNITNLIGLSQITSIGGGLLIQECDSLENLSGLENLTQVGGFVEVRINDNLVSLAGLHTLTTIGGRLDISQNSSLTTISGFNNLSSVSSVLIDLNDGLESLNGFTNISSISGDFQISGNPMLHQITSFQNLENVGGGFTIAFNSILTDLNVFSNLTHIQGTLFIILMDSLVNCSGFENLNYTGGLYVDSNPSLENFVGLENLTTIGGNLFLFGNNTLSSLSGLENLYSADDIRITNNDSLQNLEVLTNLNNPVGDLVLISNGKLTSLSGLGNIPSITGEIQILEHSLLTSLVEIENIDISNISNLRIEQNVGLSFCNASNICDYLGNGNLATISNNGFGCSDTLQLKNLCSYSDSTICFPNNVVFNNQEEVDIFPSLYPECTEVLGHLVIQSDVINLDSLAQLTRIGGTLFVIGCDTLKDLSGLDNISFVNSLYFEGNLQLENIENLSNLDTTIIGAFFSVNPKLVSLAGLENLDYMGSLNIQTNDVLMDISSLSNLNFINGNLWIRGNSALTNLGGLENIDSISGSISIESNANLTDIQALSNIEYTTITDLTIKNNPLLSTCRATPICYYLTAGGPSDIQSNAQGCNDIAEIENNCNDYFSKVDFYIFYDLNQNGIKDSGELLIPDTYVDVLPLGLQYFASQTNGGVVYLDIGNYEIQLPPIFQQEWNLSTDSSSYHIDIEKPNTCDSIFFGLYPGEFITEMVSTFSGPPARCGEYRTYETHVKNIGKTVTSGTMWLELDDLITDTIHVDIPDTMIAPNLVGWHFEDLYPGYSITKKITVRVPIPPNVELGDFLHFNTYTDFNDINGDHETDDFQYNTIILCSFDPNDKLVHTTSNNSFTLIDDNLIYTIRFQNTGNDEAYDIIIRDTLDENLDPTTFRVLSTSHPNSLITSMEDNQFLTFNFENIYLPDSTTNFEESQGYVSYLIRANENLPSETSIENTASIYFDFNPPIVTNTTENILVYDNDLDGFWSHVDCNDDDPTINPAAEEIPNNGIDEDCVDGDLMVGLSEIEGFEVSIFPNPVSEEFFIKTETPKDLIYEITDVNGRVIQSGKLTDTIHNIDFTKNSSGVYFIKIMNYKTREYIVGKIVK